MLGTAFTVFWITIVVVLSVDFVAAIVLCAIENRIKSKHPDNEGEVKVEAATTHVSGEDVYLHVKDGVVTIIDELPTVEVVKEVVKEVVRKVAVPGVAPVQAPEQAPEQVAAPVQEEVPAQEPELDAEGRVVFIASEGKHTYLDKLAALDKASYALYEQLVNYLISKEDVKQVTTSNKAIFKYKTDRLATSSVRRGAVTLQFNLINSSLERYMKAEGVKDIKVTPVTIRLSDEAALNRAKSTADLTIDYLKQEREYNAEQKKAARREARRAKAEAERAAAAAAANDKPDAE